EVEIPGCGGDEDDVAGLPRSRKEANVGNEPDAANARRGWERPSVGVVVQRDVARDDGDAEGIGRRSDALDCLLQLPPDRRFLRIAEVEAVGEREWLAS